MRRILGCAVVLAVVVTTWLAVPLPSSSAALPPTVSIGDATFVEANSGSRAVALTVTLSEALPTDLLVHYATVAGTATAPTDFKAKTAKVKIAAGKTVAKASVVVLGDTAVEGDESLGVTLTGTDNPAVTLGRSAGTIAILDDEAPPYGTGGSRTVAIGDATRVEGNVGKTATAVTLTISNPLPTELLVDYTTVPGTAAAGTDFQAKSGRVKFTAGKATAVLSLNVYGDTSREDSEAFTIQLTASNNAAVGFARPTGTITILDDDLDPPDAPDAPTATLVGDDLADLGLVDVSWSPPVDDGGSPVTGYVLEVSRNGGAWTDAGAVGLATDLRHDCGITSITCTYRVRAVNVVGEGPSSAPSAPVTTQDPLIDLGGARNYLGLGGLGIGAAGTPYEPERRWLAVSGYCTDRYQGDQLAARYFDSDSDNDCIGMQNPDYRPTNYEYVIELPETRTYATDVIVYHGNFVRNPDCSGIPNMNTPNEFCPGGQDGKPLVPTTMTLYAPDATPLDTSDNPTMASVNGCATPTTAGFDDGTKTFAPRTPASSPADSNYDFNPSPGNFVDTGSTSTSSWYRICQIPASAPGGRYVLAVRNQSSTSGPDAENTGSNAFGLVATPSSPQQLCDSTVDPTCPRVYANDHLSVYALQNGTTDQYLAELGAQHAGKQVTVNLWDAAEGATSLQLMRPTGTSTWTAQTLDYTSACTPSLTPGPSSTSVSAITNGGAVLPFNGCLLSITFALPEDYEPPADNAWWRIRMANTSAVTDRTTWSVFVTP